VPTPHGVSLNIRRLGYVGYFQPLKNRLMTDTGAYLSRYQSSGGKVFVTEYYEKEQPGTLPHLPNWKQPPEPTEPHLAYKAWKPESSIRISDAILGDTKWLNWIETETTESGHKYFWITSYVWVYRTANMFSPVPCRALTIVTHCSIEQLHNVANMAAASDMVISVAVLVRKSIGRSLALIQRLRECSYDIARLVDVKLVFVDPSQEYDDYINNDTGGAEALSAIVKKASGMFSKFACQDVIGKGMALISSTSEAYTSYPFMLMQKIARRNIEAQYILPLEINMRPSVALCAFAQQELVVNELDGKHSRKTGFGHRAFVVPSMIVFDVVSFISPVEVLALPRTNMSHRPSTI
jgi:hypothetical protein